MSVKSGKVLRWGICSTGKITHDFVSCVNALPDTEHKIVSVAARNLKTAQEFADSHNIGNAYGSYAELAKDTNIDVVYIGVIHPYHYSSAKLMLEGGKHVLCEKPLCINVGETKSLLELAKSKNLFLMEAIWTRAFPVVTKMHEVIKSGVIGEVRHVRAGFTRNFGKLPARCSEKSLSGGATTDIGVYPVQWAQLIFGEKPINQTTTGFLLESGADAESHIILEYSDNRRAVLTNSYLFWAPSEAIICGTKGYIKICDPCWCPQKMILNINGKKEEEFFFDLPKIDSKMSFDNGEGMTYEAREVRNCIMNGLTESPLVTFKMTLEIAEILQRAREQLGYKLPQDDQY